MFKNYIILFSKLFPSMNILKFWTGKKKFKRLQLKNWNNPF